MFKEHESDPPICKNHPPMAGAILWERSLFLRIKASILRFQVMEDMLNSETGKLVSRFFLEFDIFLIIDNYCRYVYFCHAAFPINSQCLPVFIARVSLGFNYLIYSNYVNYFVV